MAGPNLQDYSDVPDRIRRFYEKFPNGSLQRVGDVSFAEIDGKHFAIYTAAAYRTADDQRPGIGTAWEPVPGKSNFTRDSELMNAETSAWGRAIAALGFETKKLASREEVQNRQGSESPSEKSKNTASAKQDVRKQQMPLEIAVDLLGKLVVAKGIEETKKALAGYGIELANGPTMEVQAEPLRVLTKAQAKALIEWAK